ncbi:MAG: (d)CMP kinase [Bacteroidales bacterium]
MAGTFPPMIIAIDGFSSCGKSSFAKAIAARLGYIYIDTGAMYRAVTWYCLEKGLFPKDQPDIPAIINILPEIEISFQRNEKLRRNEISLNGQNIEEEIRSLRVAEKVSLVSSIREVRQKMVSLQRSMGVKRGLVMDGRDIGTVVFPDAEIKVFMTANPEIRAERRYKEMIEKGQSANFEDILENVKTRDRIDTTRAESPLRQAEDALVLDNSYMTPDEQMDWFEKILIGKINNPS